MAGQPCTALRRDRHHFEPFAGLHVVADSTAEHIQAADDDRQQVVEVMRDPAGHLPEGFEPLSLTRCFLGLPAFRDVKEGGDVATIDCAAVEDFDRDATCALAFDESRPACTPDDRIQFADSFGNFARTGRFLRQRHAPPDLRGGDAQHLLEFIVPGMQALIFVERDDALAHAVEGHLQHLFRQVSPAIGARQEIGSRQQSESRNDAAGNECQVRSHFGNLGMVETPTETLVGGLDDCPQILLDSLHAAKPDVGFHDFSGGVVALFPHGRDRRRQFIHLGRDIGLQLKDARPQVGRHNYRLLQIDHDLRQAILGFHIRFEIDVFARYQIAALAAFGILDRLLNGRHRTNEPEARQRIHTGSVRSRRIDCELKQRDARDEKERYYGEEQRRNNLRTEVPASWHEMRVPFALVDPGTNSRAANPSRLGKPS